MRTEDAAALMGATRRQAYYLAERILGPIGSGRHYDWPTNAVRHGEAVLRLVEGTTFTVDEAITLTAPIEAGFSCAVITNDGESFGAGYVQAAHYAATHPRDVTAIVHVNKRGAP